MTVLSDTRGPLRVGLPMTAEREPLAVIGAVVVAPHLEADLGREPAAQGRAEPHQRVGFRRHTIRVQGRGDLPAAGAAPAVTRAVAGT